MPSALVRQVFCFGETGRTVDVVYFMDDISLRAMSTKLELLTPVFSNHLFIRPILRNPDSGIREIFAGEIWNPGLWNLEYSSKNRESKFH